MKRIEIKHINAPISMIARAQSPDAKMINIERVMVDDKPVFLINDFIIFSEKEFKAEILDIIMHNLTAFKHEG